MDSILIVGLIIFTGFIFGEIAEKVRLPKVTGYIIAGIFLNPRFGLIPENFVENTTLITEISLSFITFSVGGTLFYPRIKKLGKTIVSITFFEAEAAFLTVIVGFIAMALLFGFAGAMHFSVFAVPLSILLGSLASPTDPSATLAITHEYRAKGDVSSTIMGVAAFDDAIGIINFSIGIAVAGFFIKHEGFSFFTSVLRPFITIFGGILTGVIFGVVFNMFTRFMKRETEGAFIVLVFASLSLCYGVAKIFSVDELLATMTMGCVVVNFNPQQKMIFKMLERYTEELIFVLFFTLSGMHLTFSSLSKSYLLIILFILFRSTGKYAGTYIGATIFKASAKVKRYTAFGLIPQGGIVIGLALMVKADKTFDGISDYVIGIIIGATVIHELIGPVMAKMALQKAGEIKNQEIESNSREVK